MSQLARTFGAATLCLLLLGATPDAAQAQPYPVPTNDYEVSVYGGLDFPLMDLEDAAGIGPMAGLTLARRVHEQVTLRVDGNGSFLSGTDYPRGIEGPDMQLYRVTGGAEVNLFDPKLTKWRFLVSGGAGWAFLSTDDLPQSDLIDSTEGVSTDGFALQLGAKFAYPLSGGTYLYVGADGYFHDIANNEDIRRLQRLNRPELGNWKPAWTIPVTLGLRFSL